MKTRSRGLSFLFFIAILLMGCAQTHLVSSSVMPKGDTNNRIMVVAFENDTDTPQAGDRAADIVEGVLLAKGYHILHNENRKKPKSQTEMTPLIEKTQARYLLTGSVNEWRYKTGIDGEPAVSLQLILTDTQQNKIVWSATGAKSSWGNDSIGTVAHDLVISMIDKKNNIFISLCYLPIP